MSRPVSVRYLIDHRAWVTLPALFGLVLWASYLIATALGLTGRAATNFSSGLAITAMIVLTLASARVPVLGKAFRLLIGDGES